MSSIVGIVIIILLLIVIYFCGRKLLKLEEAKRRLKNFNDDLCIEVSQYREHFLKEKKKGDMYDKIIKKYKYALFSCADCKKIVSKKNTHWLEEKPYCGKCYRKRKDS